MIQFLIQMVKIAPVLAALIIIFTTTFTFIIVRSTVKNIRTKRTLKLFRNLKHEQQHLLHVVKSNKNLTYKKIACYNYLDEQEIILTQMVKGKLDNGLYNTLIKPMIIEAIGMDEMSKYITEIEELNRDKTVENNYQNLLKLINEHNNSNVVTIIKQI